MPAVSGDPATLDVSLAAEIAGRTTSIASRLARCERVAGGSIDISRIIVV